MHGLCCVAHALTTSSATQELERLNTLHYVCMQANHVFVSVAALELLEVPHGEGTGRIDHCWAHREQPGQRQLTLPNTPKKEQIPTQHPQVVEKKPPS